MRTSKPTKINERNLLRMADLIEKIPQSQFNMSYYRIKGDSDTVECGSVGCIIGHCTKLDSSSNISRFPSGTIDFTAWSAKFTNVKHGSMAWNYLFSSLWKDVDNTPIGSAKRIRHYVKNGLPKNWEKQMDGNADLSYMNQ